MVVIGLLCALSLAPVMIANPAQALPCVRQTAEGRHSVLRVKSQQANPTTHEVSLSSLNLRTVEQGFGEPRADRSVDGHPITLGGRHFEHGLGTHSTGSYFLDLNGGSKRFSAWVGIDDETAGRGSVEFQVVGDGKMLWSSGVLRGGQPPKRVDVDLTGVRRLALLVDDAGDGFEYDHADWADARFTVTGSDPVPARVPAVDPAIAMPESPARPKITSPAVLGVRPGTELLYNICTVGERPLHYMIQGMPAGLTLDSAAGQIRGRLNAPGEHTVAITVRNRAGADTKRVRIVIGDAIALTPPLGWNSYDSYGDNVTEAEVLANARVMKAQLQPHGWEYIVVDFRWYDPEARTPPNNPNAHANSPLAADKFGRLEPAPNRFPSAANGRGFKPLADTLHAIGLKFGIHVMRGIPRQAVKANTPIEGSSYHAADAANQANTCGWCPDMFGVNGGSPAGQAWYDSILRQYAAWGVDYIKVDDMSSPYATQEIEAVHRAIERSGRSIVLSLSPGDTPISQAKHVIEHANLWRISGDFWDNWGAVSHQFDLISRWQGNGGPGHWPDADMIPLGRLSIDGRSVGRDRRTALTKSEQMTLMSLWSLAPSPLMLGMVLADNDPWTLALLTNDDVLAVDQDPLGKQAVRLSVPGLPAGVQVWTRELSDGSRVVCLFNRLSIPVSAHTAWSDLALSGPQRVRDLWQRKDLGVRPDGITAEIGPHGVQMLRVRSASR